jgi:hypothetical protein
MQACFHLRHVQWSLLRWSARPGHLYVHSQIEIRANVRCGRRCDLGLASELLRLVQIRHLIKTERNRLFVVNDFLEIIYIYLSTIDSLLLLIACRISLIWLRPTWLLLGRLFLRLTLNYL